MKKSDLGLYEAPLIVQSIECMEKRVPKTISVLPSTIAHAEHRAAQFRLTFSRYIEWLVQQDFESGQTRIVLVAEAPPEPKREERPK